MARFLLYTWRKRVLHPIAPTGSVYCVARLVTRSALFRLLSKYSGGGEETEIPLFLCWLPWREKNCTSSLWYIARTIQLASGILYPNWRHELAFMVQNFDNNCSMTRITTFAEDDPTLVCSSLCNISQRCSRAWTATSLLLLDVVNIANENGQAIQVSSCSIAVVKLAGHREKSKTKAIGGRQKGNSSSFTRRHTLATEHA